MSTCDCQQLHISSGMIKSIKNGLSKIFFSNVRMSNDLENYKFKKKKKKVSGIIFILQTYSGSQTADWEPFLFRHLAEIK